MNENTLISRYPGTFDMDSEMYNTTQAPALTTDYAGSDTWHESVISAVIAVCGALFNSLSLVYFVRHDSDQLGSRLLMPLNIFDLCVCSSSALTVFLEFFWDFDKPSKGLARALDVLLGVYVAAGESTAFATCLLSVVRCWCLCFPFNKVNMKSLVISTAGFLVYTLGKETSYVALIWTCESYREDDDTCTLPKFTEAREYLTIILISSIIVIVVLSNSISIKKVITSEGSEDLIELTKRAAVTVILVSINFCLYNTFFIVLFCVFQKIPNRHNNFEYEFFEFLTFRVFLPMNSATNPLIYLVRKLEMRQFVLRGLNQCACRIRREAVNSKEPSSPQTETWV